MPLSSCFIVLVQQNHLLQSIHTSADMHVLSALCCTLCQEMTKTVVQYEYSTANRVNSPIKLFQLIVFMFFNSKFCNKFGKKVKTYNQPKLVKKNYVLLTLQYLQFSVINVKNGGGGGLTDPMICMFLKPEVFRYFNFCEQKQMLSPI